MLIRKFFCISVVFLLIGCVSTPRYSNSKATDEKQFENGLKYSMKIYHEPIDILHDEFSDSASINGYSSNVARSEGSNKSNSFPNIKNGFAVQIASFKSKKSANNYLSELKNKRLNVPLNIRFYDGYWRIFAGLYKTRNEAEKSKVRIQSYGYLSAWIIVF